MHDTAPHTPDDRHPLGRQADKSSGQIKRSHRADETMIGVPRGSDVERSRAGRGTRL